MLNIVSAITLSYHHGCQRDGDDLVWSKKLQKPFGCISSSIVMVQPSTRVLSLTRMFMRLLCSCVGRLEDVELNRILKGFEY
ncbi:hypothetical protein ACOSQ3_011589 [Xanthoceras sorbifolium]